MRQWLKAPLVLWRSGYTLAFFLLVALYVPVLRDVYVYKRLGLSLALAIELGGGLGGLVAHEIWTVASLALVVPALLGMLLVGVPLGRLRSFVAYRRSISRAALFLVLCVGAGVLERICTGMQVVSGYRSGPGAVYDFNSLFLLVLQRGILRSFGLLGGLVSLAAGRIAVMMLIGDWGWVEAWSRYMVTATLSDLDGEFAPEHGRKRLNFQTDSCSVIRYARTRFEGRLRAYARQIPGSLEARERMRDDWVGCERDLDFLLSTDLDPEQRSLHLFETGSEALEAVLRDLPEPKCVWISPYSQPALRALLRRMEAPGCVARGPNVDGSFYSEDWARQKSKLAASLTESLSSGTTNIVLLSEVCHFTGRIIPVLELVEEIRKPDAFGTSPLSIVCVIDGSDAVGNVRRPVGLKIADYYVFAGNRWLMAPQRCAVVIRQRSGVSDAGEFDRASAAARSPVSLAALAAALDLRRTIGAKAMLERSESLRKRFVERMDPAAAVVGTDLEPSNIVVLKPRLGMRWQTDSGVGLANQCEKIGIQATVVEPTPDKPWLKFGFPYHLDGVDVDRAGRSIHALFRPA